MDYTLLGIQFKTVKPLKKAMKVVLKISKTILISLYCLSKTIEIQISKKVHCSTIHRNSSILENNLHVHQEINV